MKKFQYKKRLLAHKRMVSRSGFTLIEVLVAGSMTLIVMVGVAKISVQSITSGRARMERDRIEAAIHNNLSNKQMQIYHLNQYRCMKEMMRASIQVDT